MLRKIVVLLSLITLLALGLSAQGLDTKAAKDDWEEINFEYNSSVLVDGFPSMLRVAELLQKNPSYRARIEGNTDSIGGRSYNEKLGLARANAVRDFLIKYGTNANQITVSSAADTNPKSKSQKPVYSRTDEARWMNRRVVLTVTNGDGKTISDGSAGDAIRAMGTPGDGFGAQGAGAPAGCCGDVLQKLSKLDNIEKLLGDILDQNRQLRDQIAGLKKDQDDLKANQQSVQAKVDQTAAAVAAAPKPPTADEVAKTVITENERRNPKFSLLGLNAGPTSNGDITFTGKGRYFNPIGTHFAIQSEGEYFYSKGQREGQFDIGGLERIGRFQAGLFSSFKHVNLTGNQTGGTIGQAAVTLDYLFKWGKVGAYGTKAFMDDALINSTPLTVPSGAILDQLFTQRYLHVVDQAGISGTAPLFRENYFEGNIGYLKSSVYGDRIGGTLRLIFPVGRLVAFTVEGGLNETLLGSGNTGRAVVGVQFGNFMRPKELLAAEHAVPVQIPRVRYEVLTRTARVGNSAPVADAGPNQTLVGASTVTLNGSGSFDPNGDPITYQWTQESGPAVTLASSTSAVTTFAAAAGQSYAFRLTVKDSGGLTSSARVSISTGGPTIVAFTASPTSINFGQSSTLAWQVSGADFVSISSLGNVVATGTVTVAPTVSTTYLLTATRGAQTATATVTITVGAATGAPKITSFTVSQQFAVVGTPLQLTCSASGASSVTVAGVEVNGPTGSITVIPAVNTNYICVATAPSGLTDQLQLNVFVTPKGLNSN